MANAMTYDDALTYLGSLVNYEREHHAEAMRQMDLARMRTLCARLGDPQRHFRSILVTGTNGKGSTCAMIYAILRQADVRVGLYTSPHLEDVRERIRVASGLREAAAEEDWIAPEAFASSVARVREAIDDMRAAAPRDVPTYFEALTAAAFVYFSRQGIEIAVLEVGLGGRLDATNVVEQIVSVIGPIGLDHTDILGTNLIEIAQEKAGIVKPIQHGRASRRAASPLVISAFQPPQISALFRQLAAHHGCRFLEHNRDLFAEVRRHHPQELRLTIRGQRGEYPDVAVSLVGRHQVENAVMAVAAVEALTEDGIPHRAIRAGLSSVAWPGRLELIQNRPCVLLDGAHNSSAAESLAVALNELWPGRPKHLLLGVSADKSFDAIAAILGPLCASVTCTRSRHPRALDPARLAQACAAHQPSVAVIPDPADAYTCLINTVPDDELIVVAGSLFLVGDIRAMVRHTHAQRRLRPAQPALIPRR